MSLTLALGGVRSGKSAWSEREAARVAGRHSVLVLVNGDESDPAMVGRIAAHRARRPAHWRALPLSGLEPGALGVAGEALEDAPVVLVDGLGAWLARLLADEGAFAEHVDPATLARAGRDALDRARAVLDLLTAHAAQPGHSVIVTSEESGLGVLPIGAGTNAWLDLLGTVNQAVSAAADRAVLVVAGRIVELPALGAATEPNAPAPDQLVREAATNGDGVIAGSLDGAEVTALRVHGDRLVRPGDADHAVNVDLAGAPDWLVSAVVHASSDRAALARYPDDTAARDALGRLYLRSPAEVVPVAGAAQALWALAPALHPRLAACVHPGFTEAEAGLRAHGVPVERVLLDPAHDFALDPTVVPEEADLVVLGNPAAACGRLQSAEAIAALRRPGRTIVIDEAFIDQVPGEPESFARPDADAPPADDVIVVRSFTKALAVPGLRAGVALAAQPLADRLRAALPPWAVASPSLAAMVAIAAHGEELDARAARVQDERADLVARLEQLPGVQRWPSVTNHVLVHHRFGARAAAALRGRGVIVRPCGSFPGLTDDHLRITARDAARNEQLAQALAIALAEVTTQAKVTGAER